MGLKKIFFRIQKALPTIISFILIASITACGGGGNSSVTSETKSVESTSSNPQAMKGEITVWSFTNDLDYIIKSFNKKYPNIKVNFTQIPSDSYQQKLRSALQTGAGAPDIFFLEVAFWKQFQELPYLEDLSKPPYSADQYLNDQFGYLQDATKNDKGEIKGLTWQSTPGGFWYRRDLAQRYLGTDDPQQVSSMVSSWDKLFDVGKKVFQESGGKIHALASVSDIVSVQQGVRSEAWVKDGKLQIDPEVLKTFDLVKQARSANVDAKLTAWSPGWSASMKDGTSMFYALPSWGLHYVIRANAPDTSGKWGLAQGPEAFWGGGTWISMYSKSKVKDLAWQFLKYYTADKDFLTQYAQDQGDFVSSQSVAKEVALTQKDSFLAGQNNYEFEINIADKIKSVPITKYDSQIQTAFGNAVDLYVQDKKDKNGAIEQFKLDVKTAFPDIQVK